jgi:hypothetical protein
MVVNNTHSLTKDSVLLFEIAVFISYHIHTLCVFWLLFGMNLFILHLYKYSLKNKKTLFVAIADFFKYPSLKLFLFIKGNN